MAVNKKYNFKWWIILVLIFQFIWVISLIVYGYNRNIGVCEDYWGEKCYSYNDLEKICRCYGGNHTTTKEMLKEWQEEVLNERRKSNAEIWKDNQRFYNKANWTELLNIT